MSVTPSGDEAPIGRPIPDVEDDTPTEVPDGWHSADGAPATASAGVDGGPTLVGIDEKLNRLLAALGIPTTP